MEHRVEVMPENSTKHANGRLNIIRGILLLLFGIVIGVLAVTAIYEMYLVDPHKLPTCDAKNKALKEGRSSESQSLEILNGTLESCRAEKDVLEEAKNASEIFKAKLTTCEANNKVLQEEKSSESKSLEILNGTLESCRAAKDGFTKDAQGEVVKYRWKNAEDNCVYWGGHLVSIHSKEEFEFVNDLIQFDVKSLNEDATESNACYGSDFYAWNGLHFVNGRRKWSDGTPDDYIGQDRSKNTLYYMMCNDISNVPSANELYVSEEPDDVNARFVCKKDANE
ncbi:unnamed protein product, partial [Mesorhabditis belari]|uniref:C-type lectin domain-containing protein n=1 Tax=Mesorhabditis belari TaxID=2138241 RepID=A0AAF3EJZ5_9BILA